jgi:hypothetical protein
MMGEKIGRHTVNSKSIAAAGDSMSLVDEEAEKLGSGYIGMKLMG